MIDGWVVIPNWSKWQSRRDRSDPWLKDFIDQLDRDEYTALTFAERGLLVDCRKIFARHDGQIRTSKLPGLLGQRVWQKHLDRLAEAGYIDIVAAKPPPISGETAARAREEEEKEKEVDTPYPAERGNIDNGTPRTRGENPRALGTNPRAVAERTRPERNARRWIDNGLADQVPPDRLEAVIADEFDLHEPELVAELATYARNRGRK